MVQSCSTACYIALVATIINQRELRNSSGDIMRRLDAGETFIVTRNGEPVGELVPLRRHRYVSKAVVAAAFAGAPSIDAARFRGDIEAFADPDIEPRA